GLGLFIAKTLLERSGAEMSFANGSDPLAADPKMGDRTGAIVDVVWPTEAIVAKSEDAATGLGENRPIEA
ncbi:MAG: sensor histidine kinase, partial [Alphaproteobacteria bacterium]|nr:sensor histidine kinase [Alphaproteobacteria bacterium]